MLSTQAARGSCPCARAARRRGAARVGARAPAATHRDDARLFEAAPTWGGRAGGRGATARGAAQSALCQLNSAWPGVRARTLGRQVLVHLGADDVALLVDEDLDELAEAARVVVAARLRVAEGLEHRVRLQDRLGQRLDAAAALGAPRKVVHEVLVRLGLARARLAAHHDRLRLVRAREHLVRVLRGSVHVRWLFAQRLATVRAHLGLRVDGQLLERVHREQDRAGERVDLLGKVASAHVLEQRRLGEVNQHRVVGRRQPRRVGRRQVGRAHLDLGAGAEPDLGRLLLRVGRHERAQDEDIIRFVVRVLPSVRPGMGVSAGRSTTLSRGQAVAP